LQFDKTSKNPLAEKKRQINDKLFSEAISDERAWD
jgi:hypothetical protein